MVSKYFSMGERETRTPQSFAQLDSETLRRSMKHEKILSDHRTGHSAERVPTYATRPKGFKGKRKEMKGMRLRRMLPVEPGCAP